MKLEIIYLLVHLTTHKHRVCVIAKASEGTHTQDQRDSGQRVRGPAVSCQGSVRWHSCQVAPRLCETVCNSSDWNKVGGQTRWLVIIGLRFSIYADTKMLDNLEYFISLKWTIFQIIPKGSMLLCWKIVITDLICDCFQHHSKSLTRGIEITVHQLFYTTC